MSIEDAITKKLVPMIHEIVADEIAKLSTPEPAHTKENLEEFGRSILLTLSTASQLTGWNERWIRRNLPVVQAQGCTARVQLTDILRAVDMRKDK